MSAATITVDPAAAYTMTTIVLVEGTGHRYSSEQSGAKVMENLEKAADDEGFEPPHEDGGVITLVRKPVKGLAMAFIFQPA